jgi:two-component system chemotaxis sensor kinase CheA
MSEDQNQEVLDARLLALMLEDFLEESQEHLDRLNLGLAQLEEKPDDGELINEIFRTAHTLKGTASFVGLDKMREVAHRMEDLFGAIRKGSLTVTATLIDAMFEALEMLTLLRDKARAKDPENIDITAIIHNLSGFTETGSSGGTSPTPEESGEVGETLPDRPAGDVKSAPLISDTIRVPTVRLDNFMNLVGEMITSVNRLNDYSGRFRDHDLATIASTVTRLTRQIHTGLMSVRMVPVERLFNKFPGVVRNLARERNKEVELTITGRETELDKTVIEQMYDPLVHLLRNAVAHGIETPDRRRVLGKSPVGSIRLSARHQQNSIIIEISDDGEGIDPDKMRQTAAKKGVMTAEAASNLTDEQAIHLVFLPGFSSAETVTDVSGRGVGMDVVRESVRKLRGTVDISTTKGKGVTFRIQLPLTLAIIEVLLVRAGALAYALPIHSVRETLLVDSSEIETMEKKAVIFIRGQALPLMELRVLLGGGQAVPHHGKVPVVVLGTAGGKVAVSVDELLGKQDVVMKPLGEYLGKVEGVEGAAILADGGITLIIDLEFVLRNL